MERVGEPPPKQLGGDIGAGQGQEALHIQMTPTEEGFNQYRGLEISGCWTTLMRRQGGAIVTNL